MTTSRVRSSARRFRYTQPLGPASLESAYRVCLHEELVLKRLKVEAEWPIAVAYRGRQINVGYRIDLLVEDRVLVELKALTKVLPIHEAQLLSYLRLGGYPLGLLINFHVPLLRDGIRRMVNQVPGHKPWSPSTTEKT